MWRSAKGQFPVNKDYKIIVFSLSYADATTIKPFIANHHPFSWVLFQIKGMGYIFQRGHFRWLYKRAFFSLGGIDIYFLKFPFFYGIYLVHSSGNEVFYFKQT